MQKRSVAGIGARAVPRSLHTPMIRRLQPGMKPDDVFPIAMLCNTRPQLTWLAAGRQLRVTEYRTHRTLSGYGLGRPGIERALTILERSLPRAMHHGIVLVIDKPAAPSR